MKKMKKSTTKFGLNALVWKEANLFVAKAVEIEVVSQGKTAKKALSNLQEALELYFQGEKIPCVKIPSLPELKLEKLFPKIQYA